VGFFRKLILKGRDHLLSLLKVSLVLSHKLEVVWELLILLLFLRFVSGRILFMELLLDRRSFECGLLNVFIVGWLAWFHCCLRFFV
jgi:hypothetical protein